MQGTMSGARVRRRPCTYGLDGQ